MPHLTFVLIPKMEGVGKDDVTEQIVPGSIVNVKGGFIWKSRVMLQVKPMVDEFSAPLWKSTWTRQVLLKS